MECRSMRVPRLVAGCRSSVLVILGQFAAAAEPMKVPLVVDWPIESPATVAFPAYCGLSLPKGAVISAREIAVVDGAGNAVPASVEPLARWTPEKSLKWVGLRFLA